MSQSRVMQCFTCTNSRGVVRYEHVKYNRQWVLNRLIDLQGLAGRFQDAMYGLGSRLWVGKRKGPQATTQTFTCSVCGSTRII